MNRVLVWAIIRLAGRPRREKKAVEFSAAFARKQGTGGSSALSESTAFAVKLDTTPTNAPSWQRST